MIRYGILGCGGHALHSHAIPGKAIQELSLVSLCDLNPEVLRQFELDYGSELQTYTDTNEFFESELDAVLIATPDEFHIENMRQAIRHNLDILVEKPLAMNVHQLTELEELLDEAEYRKLVITSCHPRRFDPPFLWLKERTASFVDAFGPVIGFDFDFSYHQPTASWKHDRSLMLDHVNHEIDLTNFLYGTSGFKATLEADSFDHYQVSGKRADGIFFRFRGTRRLEHSLFKEWVTVRHERATVEVDSYEGQARVQGHDCDYRSVIQDACGSTDYALRFERVMQNFADAMGDPQKNYLSRQDLWLNNWLGVTLDTEGSCEWSSN